MAVTTARQSQNDNYNKAFGELDVAGSAIVQGTVDCATLKVNGTTIANSSLPAGAMRVSALVEAQGTPTSINTAGATTLTIAQLLTGLITIDCNGAGRTVTFPTAALAVAGVSGCAVGDTIYFLISNGSDAAETITLAEGSGGGWDTNFLASKTIAQNGARLMALRFTNVTASSEAYKLYM